MKLTILGGGGFRVPLVHGALLRDTHPGRVEEVVLHDTSSDRLAVMSAVLREQAAEARREHGATPPSLHATTDLREAVTDTDVVFSAIRVGGAQGRTCDERVALDLGLLGQETTGPGGIAYGLRTIPVVMDIARTVAEVAPRAYVINFTNPAGMITQAMQQVLGDRVVGICDSPIGLGRRAAAALGLDPARTSFDYAGLNHLGWLRGLRYDGRDVLPDLLADPARLVRTEEGRLFGPEWLATIGAIPNEYVYYYDFTREAIASITGATQTRGEFLLRQQSAYYAAALADPDGAWRRWREVRAEREETYMAEARAEGEERDLTDVGAEGYEQVALSLMRAISRGERGLMILNVRNGTTLPGLPADAVVEVPCAVDASGPRPLATAPLTGRMLGLTAQVKHAEELTIEAALTGSRQRAVQAFASHPLVDSVALARHLLDGYRARIPGVADVVG